MVDARTSVAAPVGLFVNAAAGSARSWAVRAAVAGARRRLDADLHEIATRDAGELREWLEERIGAYRTAVIAGGDGSLGVALNVAAASGVTLGYLPAGFGNAAAHLLRLPRHAAGLEEVLVCGEARAVDLVEVDGRLALFAGAGLDALAARRYSESRLSGALGWAVAIARTVPDAVRPRGVRVVADGRLVHDGPLQLLVVSTTPFYGRGLRVNPGARPDAGRLALRAYRGSLPTILDELVRWVVRVSPRTRGRAAQEVLLESRDGRPLSVQADGDIVGERTAWEFRIRPRAVRLIGNWS